MTTPRGHAQDAYNMDQRQPAGSYLAPEAPRERWSGGPAMLAVATVGAVLAAVAYGAWTGTQSCDGFECLGADLLAAAVSGVVIPVLAWLTLWLIRIPRSFLLAATVTATGHLLAWLVMLAEEARAGFPADVPLGPAWAYLLCGAAAGAFAAVVVGRGPWSRGVRLGLVGGLAALTVAGLVGHQTLETRHAEDELASVPVTAYLPDLEGARATSARVTPQGAVQIYYRYDDGRAVYPDVYLVPVTGTDLCEVVTSRTAYIEVLGRRCVVTGDEVSARDGLHQLVGIRRGDTLVVASYTTGELDDATVLEQLRSAPRSDAGTLARLSRSS